MPLRTSVEDFARTEGQRLLGLAYSLTGSRQQSEDIVQEVFARLLAKDLESITDLTAYARRAVCNEAATWGRRLTRNGRRGQKLRQEWDRQLKVEPDPFGRVEVLSALRVLNTRQRTAIVLRYYLDLPDTEIAAVLGCAPATVRTHLVRGLRRLRAELDQISDHNEEDEPWVRSRID